MNAKLSKRLIVAGGKKIRFLYGGHGPPLIFIHGLPTSPECYSKSLAILSSRFTIYAPYIFKLNCATTKEIANALFGMMKALNLNRVTVVGTSFGGIIASHLSIIAGKTVSSLVLVNTAGVPREASAARSAANFFKSITAMLLHGQVDVVLNRVFAALGFCTSLWQEGPRDLLKEVGQKVHLCYLFNNIAVKTTIIWSKSDEMFPPSCAKVLAKFIKKSRLVTVEGTHAWVFHKPEEFAETILAAAK